jgi:signal transduction histidine kinase
MRSIPLGPEVASRVEALVGGHLRPSSDDARLSFIERRLKSFGALPLVQRFALTAAPILLAGMALMGQWVGSRIEHGVVLNAAGHLAFSMTDELKPVGQELSSGQVLSPSAQQLIEGLLNEKNAGGQVVAIKIWRPDASFAYATDHTLIGRSFPMFKELSTALRGDVTAVYNDTRRDHLNELAAQLKMPLFEIYVPIRSADKSRIVAVAEFYQNAELLETGITQARKNTWFVVGAITLGMFTLLYGVVRGASCLIDQQRQALESRIAEEEALNQQNSALRQQLQLANRRGTELNERFLRRISSDLHDGPAQHLALALLRLDELAPVVNAAAKDGATKHKEVLASIRSATADAMKEIRNISSGLALPELQKITPADALTIAARAHERSTGTAVRLTMSGLPQRLPLPLTICMFRFAQEGLNNAFRHAGGVEQKVTARCDGAIVEVEVSDGGKGCAPERISTNERIGLAGLRHRVETLGGSLHIQSEPGRGTRLSARFPNASAGERNA